MTNKRIVSGHIGFDMPVIGQRTNIYFRDGRVFRTSPIQKFHIDWGAGFSFIETANTVYVKAFNQPQKLVKVASKVFGYEIIYLGQPCVLKVDGVIVRTSKVVAVRGNEIETANTIYKIA